MLHKLGPKKRLNSIFAWLIWGIGAVFTCYQFTIQTSPSVMSEAIMSSFHVTSLGIGILSATFFIPYVFLQVPAGALIDYYGVRKLYVFALPIISAGCLIFSFSGNIYLADLSRMLIGAAASVGVVGAMTLAANWFDPRHFAMMAGLVETLCLIGGAIGEHGLAQVVVHQGWRPTMIILAMVGGILWLLSFLFVQDSPDVDVVHEPIADEPVGLKNSLKILLKNKQVVTSSLFCGLCGVVTAVFASLWAVSFVERIYHVRLDKAALASALIFVGAAVGSPIIGKVSDTLGRRKPVMIVCASFALVLMIDVLYFPPASYTSMCALLCLLGFASSGYMLSFAVTQESTPRNLRSTAIGLTNMLCMSGSLVLQPIIGGILTSLWQGVQRHGVPFYSLTEYQFALTILPVCLIAALITLCFMQETYCVANTQEEVIDDEPSTLAVAVGIK